MIVNRRTFIVKKGCMDRAVEMLRQAGDKRSHSLPRRLYRPDIGPFDQLVLEIEHEDLADYERYWQAIRALSWFEDWMAEWLEITETGGRNEIWQVETV